MNRSRIIVVLTLVGATCVASGARARAQDKEAIRHHEVVIFEGVPLNEDTRPDSARLFEPTFFMPAEKASDITINMSQLKSDAPNEKDTCLGVIIGFGGPNEWASVVVVPAGTVRAGDRPPVDIGSMLGAGKARKVYLELKARRKADTKAVVGFRVGGQGAGRNVDAIRPPAALAVRVGEKEGRKFQELSADWQTYRIELTNVADKIDKVYSPLSLIVESNAHAKQQTVSFFIDDVKFVAE